MIFSLLKIHTQHSKKPSPPGGGLLFPFSLFRTSAKEAAALVPRESSAWRCTDRGILSFEKEVSPLKPREKGRGVLPLDPAYIGSLWLEELRDLRNRVRCTWLRHESLHFVTIRNRALLRGARVTVVRRRTACGGGFAALAAGGIAAFLFQQCSFSVNGPQLMEIRTGQLRDLA